MAANSTLIGQALEAAVPAFQGCPVERRKAPEMEDGESPPLVVVGVLDQTDSERLWAGPSPADLVRYSAWACLITAGGEEAADDDAVRDWLAAAQAVMNRPASYPVDGLNEVWAGARTPFPAAGRKATLNYTLAVARVEVIEAR